MSRQKRVPGLGDAPVTRARGGARDRLRDAGSKELALLAKKVGNSQVGALLGASTEKRDALLAFVERRLSEIQMVQRAEQKEMTEHRDWHLLVARGAAGFGLPDPTRWHRTTLLYRRAAEALCAGDLSRGAHLLDQAVAAERAAFDTVPGQVELPSSLAAPSTGPEERPFVGEGESCPATKAPALFHRADAILAVTATSNEVPGHRLHANHHWWDVVEEEEADAKGKKGEKKDSEAGKGGEAPDKSAAVEAGRKTVEPEAEEAAQEVAVVTEPALEEPAVRAPRKGRKPDGR